MNKPSLGRNGAESASICKPLCCTSIQQGCFGGYPHCMIACTTCLHDAGMTKLTVCTSGWVSSERLCMSHTMCIPLGYSPYISESRLLQGATALGSPYGARHLVDSIYARFQMVRREHCKSTDRQPPVLLLFEHPVLTRLPWCLRC